MAARLLADRLHFKSPGNTPHLSTSRGANRNPAVFISVGFMHHLTCHVFVSHPPPCLTAWDAPVHISYTSQWGAEDLCKHCSAKGESKAQGPRVLCKATETVTICNYNIIPHHFCTMSWTGFRSRIYVKSCDCGSGIPVLLTDSPSIKKVKKIFQDKNLEGKKMCKIHSYHPQITSASLQNVVMLLWLP